MVRTFKNILNWEEKSILRIKFVWEFFCFMAIRPVQALTCQRYHASRWKYTNRNYREKEECMKNKSNFILHSWLISHLHWRKNLSYMYTFNLTSSSILSQPGDLQTTRFWKMIFRVLPGCFISVRMYFYLPSINWLTYVFLKEYFCRTVKILPKIVQWAICWPADDKYDGTFLYMPFN